MKKIVLITIMLISAIFANAQWQQTNGPNGGYINCIAFSGNHIFAGTYSGVFLSTDNGSNWTTVNNGLTNQYVLSLAVSGTNIFAGTDGGGVFLSTDNGSNWSAVNNGLTSQDVWSLAVSGTNIFAGTYNGGVFLSTDNGSNWSAVNNGLTSQDIWSFAVSGNNIFAGTNGSSVWKRPLSEMPEGIEELDNSNDLLVYPNPANDKITIDRLSSNANTGNEISIYDLQGKLLLKQPLYQTKTDINISDLAAGIYFIKWAGEEGVVVKKFVKE